MVTRDVHKALMQVRPGATPSEIRARLSELCKEHDYDPIKALLEIISDARAGTVKDAAIQICQDMEGEGCSAELVERMRVITVKIPSIEMRELIGIHKEILQYIAPKLRSMDIQAHVDTEVHVAVAQFNEVPADQDPVAFAQEVLAKVSVPINVPIDDDVGEEPDEEVA